MYINITIIEEYDESKKSMNNKGTSSDGALINISKKKIYIFFCTQFLLLLCMYTYTYKEKFSTENKEKN